MQTPVSCTLADTNEQVFRQLVSFKGLEACA